MRGDVSRAATSTVQFDALFDEVSNWARWDEESPRGTLNHLTPARVVAATRLVRTGETVGLGLPLDTEARPGNPSPAEHRMTQLTADGSGAVRFVKDYIGVDFHNDGHSHLDALCHVSYRGNLFGGAPDSSTTGEGATRGDVTAVKDGLVGRGVLLDIPRLRGVPWLEPGDAVQAVELEAAEQAQRVPVLPGDILLVRTGQTRRLSELERWDTTRAKAGLHPDTAPFLTERQVAVLGSDSNSDAVPGVTADVPYPMHVLAINAMGLHLLDYLEFEDLAAVCERTARWEFLCVVAPLRIPGGTGSPVNPIAIF